VTGAGGGANSAGRDDADPVSRWVAAWAGCVPPSLATVLCGPLGLEAVLRAAPVRLDVNEVVDEALNALAGDPATTGAWPEVRMSPEIGAATGRVSALALAAALILRRAAVAPPLRAGVPPAIELLTRTSDGSVCLEVRRAGAAVEPSDDMLRWLAAWAGADFGSGPGVAVLCLPNIPWSERAGSVLVVDDAPVVCEVILRTLSRSAIRADACMTLDEVEARLRFAPGPDLILAEASVWSRRCGWFVPWLAQTCPDLIRRTAVMAANPVSAETVRALTALGRRWFLSKPFSAAALLALVRRRLMCLGR
jgi:CheY-like chemotaxis protein